jgi:hypothetical protein
VVKRLDLHTAQTTHDHWLQRRQNGEIPGVENGGSRSKGNGSVEVLTSEPTASSTARWLRLSNRISKPDLVQVVRAVADWATGNRASRSE